MDPNTVWMKIWYDVADSMATREVFGWKGNAISQSMINYNIYNIYIYTIWESHNMAMEIASISHHMYLRRCAEVMSWFVNEISLWFNYEYISHKPYLTYCTCANAAKDWGNHLAPLGIRADRTWDTGNPNLDFFRLAERIVDSLSKKVPKRISFWSDKWCLAPSVLKSERLKDSKNRRGYNPSISEVELPTGKTI